jgi:AcrR family transcriptional regulator
VNTKRSLPTPRAEGMTNIIDATRRLLQTNDPGDITLRDVARESGHGPRLIIEWFGGKGGLFATVCEEIFSDLASSGELFYSDVALRPEVVAAFRVFNHMQVNHPEVVVAVRSGAVLETVKKRLQEHQGRSEDDALRIARRISVLTLGLALFREYVGLSEEETVQMYKDEFFTSTGILLPDNPNRT